MRVIIFTLLIASILCVTAFLAAFAPYHYYNEAINVGLKGPYLTLSSPGKHFLKGKEYKLSQMKGLISITDELWGKQHFSHMEIPFPIKHPQVSFVPIIKDENFGISLGGRFLNVEGGELANFMLTKSFPLIFSTKGQKIFNLPIYKKMILNTGPKILWRDLFLLDIRLPVYKENIVNYLEELWQIPYEKLVYNLYILYLRNQIFPEETQLLRFHEKKNMGVIKTNNGVVKVKDEHLGNVDSYHERYYILKKGVVYTVSVTIKSNNIVSESIRLNLIKNMNYRASDDSASEFIYGKYKRLSYEEKISQMGLIYLYTAWSHDTNDKNYMKQMIQYLERGKDNIIYLAPLYEYSYKKFGSNFSIKSGTIKEDASELLKRKIKEEMQNEIEIERNKHISGENVEFENDQEKIKYHLQKAKLKGSNVDDDDDIITIE
jgi:hypothetical protein